MKIISTNIGPITTIVRNGQKVQTGIYKHPSTTPIYLGNTDVLDDTVVDRAHHGGVNKACYLFSTDQYPYWQKLYPRLEWNWGMFGENLSIEGFDDTQIRIGDIYRIGTALVQVTQPREPCYKLGVRFEDEAMVLQFLEHGYPGTYVRILEEGYVQKGDAVVLIERSENTLTVSECLRIILSKDKDRLLLQKAIDNPSFPEYKKERLKKYL
ncbi:MOSC domain-containing protein YiiM [Arenibacter nanhaiticus]|uniref:MOSC domain-containing protein YiiM n=1 Tax=Arenibacter nanhaiticus TaxID=558155 RepID=A0A1M6IBI9_9FLAO|nr:MOSC domain-containing protein [Arenibacter nanhaiticus]SHJ31804.1 MOSC domain-containing protein YiiM [Arenibacter nanhaiticus]